MSEQFLTGDKERLRIQLEQLKREYEMTAQRLQRSQRKEAVRKHVQDRISELKRPLQDNGLDVSELSGVCSSGSDPLSNQTQETVKKAPVVRFHLPEEPNASPWGTPTYRRSPTHRLRSKRSLLRLQSRERESDADHSQEKETEGEKDGCGRGAAEKERTENRETPGGKKRTDGETEWKEPAGTGVEEEKMQKDERRDGEDGEEGHKKKGLGDEVRESDGDQQENCRQPDVAKDPAAVKVSNGARSVGRNISSYPAEQLFTTMESCPSSAKEEMTSPSEAAMPGTDGSAHVSRGDMNATPCPSGKVFSLDSCTVVEGLPFPVEYYIRTTRRMAATQSSVDLDAVIQSQLFKGRGRRRSGLSQTRGGGRKVSEPSARPGDPSGSRGRGRRRRRGRGRKRATTSSPENPSESSLSSSSSFLLQSQSSLPGETRPQAELKGQFETVADFKHLLDTQLYLDSRLFPDPKVYPIFRKRRGQAGRTVLRSQTPRNDVKPLLASHAQAWSTGDVRNLGKLLMTFDVQDFHLPDDEFGHLKLERLCSSTSSSNVEPFGSRYYTRRSSRTLKNAVRAGVPSLEGEEYAPEPLAPSSSLEGSLPLSPADPSDMVRESAALLALKTTRQNEALALQEVLNLSLPSTSHTQRGPDPSLPRLGTTPHRFSPSTPSLLTPPLSLSDQSCSLPSSQSSDRIPVPVEARDGRAEMQEEEEEEDAVQAGPEPRLETETSEHAGDTFEAAVPEEGVVRAENERGRLRGCKEAGAAPEKVDPSQMSSMPPPAGTERSDGLLQGVLHKTHTLKALKAGCVSGVCLVQWPSEERCVCVASERSVCVWAQRAGDGEWELLHTWTFTQSVVSLQAVPDLAGLLCVALGRTERGRVTEVRTLWCGGLTGHFSEVRVCKGALQTVLAVSDLRLVCCSVPGVQQTVTVLTLAQDGGVSDSLSLFSTNLRVETLALVEGQKDALIGWTECKTLLIWNMKSGHLLQSIQLAQTMCPASCLRGYSYKGLLCALLQSAGACEDDYGSRLFTLIATNPLTGKYITLSSISSPAPHTERLVDGDVCGSSLVGVFQSGRLAIWDVRGGDASVLADGPAESCHLARWAGPSTLLAGYVNGDVGLFQYQSTDTTKTI